MTETTATPSATTASTTASTTAQFKAAILELIEENNPQLTTWLQTSLSEITPKYIENDDFATPSSRTRSELPFWKAHPDLEPMTPPKGGSISNETLEKLQELFKDAPPAEEIIAYLTK